MPHKRCFLSSGLGLIRVLWSTHIPSYLPAPTVPSDAPPWPCRLGGWGSTRPHQQQLSRLGQTHTGPQGEQGDAGGRGRAGLSAPAWANAHHFLLKRKLLSRVWLFATPWTRYSPLNSPGQNTAVASLSFSKGSSQPTGLPHYRQILYQQSHKGSPFPT